jgi:hypothetical protein
MFWIKICCSDSQIFCDVLEVFNNLWAFLVSRSVKKDGVIFLNPPHLLNMFPQFYLLHLQRQLNNTEYLTLKILVYLWQSQKQVSIELLAILMPNPFQFESRRGSVQRFLKLSSLNIESLWFPRFQ